jgi:hypothetical protein
VSASLTPSPFKFGITTMRTQNKPTNTGLDRAGLLIGHPANPAPLATEVVVTEPARPELMSRQHLSRTRYLVSLPRKRQTREHIL